MPSVLQNSVRELKTCAQGRRLLHNALVQHPNELWDGSEWRPAHHRAGACASVRVRDWCPPHVTGLWPSTMRTCVCVCVCAAHCVRVGHAHSSALQQV